MSEAIYELTAEARDTIGRSASRRLRKQNLVPAIIYGGHAEPQSITLQAFELKRAMQHESFSSHILTVNVNGKPINAVLKDLQRHPFRDQVLHIDFQRIEANEKITMNVPIHYLNEKTAEGVKQGGSLSRLMIETEVRCLPAELPEYLEVDVKNLKMGEALHLSDISLPEGVEITQLSYGADHDQPILSISPPRGGVQDNSAQDSDASAESSE
jgi:large subunit ribosomal protein L25